MPKDEAFHPNQLAVLRIVDYRKENSLVVPVNVVQHSESGSYLMVAENKNNSWIAQRRDVKVGLAYDSNCEILEGLQAGDRLITTGFQDLNPGDKIKF